MTEISYIKRQHQPAPASYTEFLSRMQAYAKRRGVAWNIPLSPNGMPLTGHDWDLRILVDSHARYASHLNGFSINKQVRSDSLKAGFSEASVPQGEVLSERVQDFIKAMAVFRSTQGIQPVRTSSLVRILRNFFSYTVKAPWELATADFEFYSRVPQRDTHACDQLTAIARVMSAHLLSLNCPIRPLLKTSLSDLMLKALDERSHPEKLPNEGALLELTRICFQGRSEKSPGSCQVFGYTDAHSYGSSSKRSYLSPCGLPELD